MLHFGGILLSLAAALAFANGIPLQETLAGPQPIPTGGKKWAVLVAGSASWGNYRHQSDVCHAYQVLIEHGFDPANIITFMMDDIAQNAQNPTKGTIINHPNGPNVCVYRPAGQCHCATRTDCTDPPPPFFSLPPHTAALPPLPPPPPPLCFSASFCCLALTFPCYIRQPVARNTIPAVGRYANIGKDYTGKDVTPNNFLNVITGNKTAMAGIGSGKVLESTSKDHVFINFVDHGGPHVS